MAATFRRVIDAAAAGVARVHVRRQRRAFLDQCRRPQHVQNQLARLFAQLHADSELGRQAQLARIRDVDDLRRALPIRDFEQYRPLVERVYHGDRAALLGPGAELIMFAKTSGTTGRAKYIPVTDAFVRHYRRGWNIFGGCVIDDHPSSYLRAIIQLSSAEDEEMTPAGVPAGAISGLLAAMQKWIIRRYYPAPIECRHIRNFADKLYVAIRMSIGSDPAFITTANPSTQLALARLMDADAERLIRDVNDGTLDVSLDLPPRARLACAMRLRPDAALAGKLQAVRHSTGALRPKNVWRLDFLCNWTGGTLGLYLGDFPEYFGQTPVRDIGLLASEGRVTIPLEDGTPAGILDVINNVFEFIPEDEYGRREPDTLEPHQLVVGKRYFVIMTNPAGLFRYDLGDLVECVGFVGQTPKLAFLSKGRHTASVTGEKVTEHQIVHAVQAAAAELNVGLNTFVVAPVWGQPPHYRMSMDAGHALHRDAAGEPLPGWADAARQTFAAAIDTALQRSNVEYASKRASGRLAALEVRLLPSDTLAQLDRSLIAQRGGRADQFKHQYLYPAPGGDDAALGTPDTPAPAVARPPA